MPIDALVSPLPSELTTPPVTKMNLVMARASSVNFREIGILLPGGSGGNGRVLVEVARGGAAARGGFQPGELGVRLFRADSIQMNGAMT